MNPVFHSVSACTHGRCTFYWSGESTYSALQCCFHYSWLAHP